MNIKKSLDRYWSWYNEVVIAGKWLAYLKTLPPAPNELAYKRQIESFNKKYMGMDLAKGKDMTVEFQVK